MDLFGVDVFSAIGGAAASAFTLGLRSVMIAPIKAAIDRARFIRWLSVVFPQKPFSDTWDVAWHVDSTRFQPINIDNVKIYSVLGNITFSTTTTLLDGSKEQCVFVGKLSDRTITGRWYDPKDEGRGYFGVFQITLHGTLKDGAGYWSGWSTDGSVQSNKMTVKRVNTQ